MRKLHFKHIFALIINSGSIRAGILGLFLYLSTEYFMSNPKVFEKNETKTVQAHIDQVYKSLMNVENDKVWIFCYTYQIDNVNYKAKSFHNKMTKSTGDNVTIKYVVSNPKKSKIVGFRDNFFPRNLFLLIILSAFGFFNLVIGLFIFLRRIEFIRNGTLIRAFYDNHFSLLGNVKTKSGNIFRLTLRYSILSFNDIKKNFYFASVKYLHNKFDYKLLVDTNNPKRAIIINNLPKKVLKLIEEQ